MKKQISRLSPHQNGKVFGVLIAVSSLVFIVPMSLMVFFLVPDVDHQGNSTVFPKFMILLFPVFYFIFGYVATAVGSLVYNSLFKFVGGFEFEVKDRQA